VERRASDVEISLSNQWSSHIMSRSPAVLREWNFNVPVTALAVTRDGAWIGLAMGDGSFRFLPASEEAKEPKELGLHNGISLSFAPDADAHAFLSGGDDGRVYIIDPALNAPTLLAEHKGKWIDHVAATEGFRAYSVGKEVHLLDDEGQEKLGALQLPSSAGGLAFSPNGKRLAATHYNGISLFWTNAKDTISAKLTWKGSHLGAIWHPDGKIVLSSMQESSLHGWRLSDMNEMQMQGYVAKVHSMDFTAKGKYLATSGAPQVICWPFFGGGPWGKTPLTLGSGEMRLVTRVAAHPKDDLVAAGYDDGLILLSPLDGRMDMMINLPVGAGAAVVGLGWNKGGDCLFAALENGTLMLFTIDSVKKAVRHV
jgi:WD40 repeat protein